MPHSLTLYDFKDEDLLYILEEVGDKEGWATSREVALRIDINHKHPSQCVGSRFAWAFRFGILEKKKNKDGEMIWRLNAIGESLLHPVDMSKELQAQMANLTEAQRLRVTQMISKEIAKEARRRVGARSAAHLSQRAWRHSMGAWRDPKIAVSRV